MAISKFIVVLLLFISAAATAQTNDTTFKKEWIDIDTLIVKSNLPKTALQKVNALYKKATAQNLEVQVIKCLIYRMSIEDRVFDNKPNNAINLLQKEISQTTIPAATSILYCLLANRYQQYYNNNRWKFYNRSKTINFKKEDIETWNAEDFGSAISQNYLLSLKNAKALQQIKLAAYDAIILKGNARYLRPTLYDVLVHEALDYFKSGDYYLTKPAYAFELININAIKPQKIFLNTPFESKDTSSHLLQTLNLFKQLLQFHINDDDKNALLDVDLERIQWVHENLIHDEKEAQFCTTLQGIAKYKASRASQANYLLAEIERNKANTYQPFGDTTQRYANIEALQIINDALIRFKDASEGTANLQNLHSQIIQPTLSTETEKVNLPNQPFRMLVKYKSVNTVFVRVIKIDAATKKNIGRWEKKYWQQLAKLPIYKSFEQVLPATNDYQNHSVEIKIDALPVGEYKILCSSSNAFIDSIDKMTVQDVYISNISYIKNGNDYFVLNRETGEPLQKVKVTITHDKWNSKIQKSETLTTANLVSDKNGHFIFSPEDNYGNYHLAFISNKDKLDLDNNEYIYRSYSNNNSDDDEDVEPTNAKDIADYEKDKASIFFFTDRSIYRLGQTVYFKGIAITKDYTTKQNKILANKDSVLVYLQDANRKQIDSLYFKTNSYGSFSGTFKIPQNVLTGSFTIEADEFKQSNVSFKVEEYKRPKFYVEFEKAKGAYRINDSVTITGTAKAYAGNAVDGAKVKFNVKRNARFIYDWYWRGSSKPKVGSQQISNGEITTDAEGKFKITFKALADESVNKNIDPLFDFSISADVTDVNGETRSSSTQVTVGYKSLVLNVSVPKLAIADSVKSFYITTKNLSDEKEPAFVTVKIFAVETPNRLIRKSLWQPADQFVMNKQQYIANFPHDDYNDELNETNWQVKQLITEGKINTDVATNYQLTNIKFLPGYYKIEATTKDKDGNEVKDIQYMQLFSNNASPYPQYNFNYTINDYAEPGSTASFLTGSMADKIFVIQKVQSALAPSPLERAGGEVNKKVWGEFLINNKGLHTITYTSTEADRGNIAINQAYVIHNRAYTNHFEITVPYTNKNLQVSYTSFRNKTEPGNKETWTVKINGNKGEQVAAELLTSMYDASLDQFKAHNWSVPNIWQNRNFENGFSVGNGFNSESSYDNNNYKVEKNIETRYDELVKNYWPIQWFQNNTWARNATNGGSVIKQEDYYKTLTSKMDFAGETMLAGKSAGINISSKSNGVFADTRVTLRGVRSVTGNEQPLLIVDGVELVLAKLNEFNPNDISSTDVLKSAEATAIYGAKGANGVIIITTKSGAKKKQEQPIQPRKNFNETAFFFPNLYADTAGNYTFSFTIPEALTQWKWLSFAHTKNLAFGNNSTIITTQKTLMVQPNTPRFLREGDNLELATKIVNLSDKELTGQATLELIDATTGTSVDGWFNNSMSVQFFTAAAGQSTVVKFPMVVPFSFNKPLTWRIIAKAGAYGDGEENTLPVLTNRMLVTETLPLYLKPNETSKSFTFDKLINNKSESLTNESLTVEYTANPIWNVIQSLPYLMEYPYECAEQTFNRFYANALAASIVSKYPNIKAVFEVWKNDTTTFKSNLQKNEELKQILLQETPWVLNAESETQQQKNIALLFDVVKMSNAKDATIEKLQQLQMESGGFAWFKGGREDRYITNYILTGLGKLQKNQAIEQNEKLKMITAKALKYVDEKIKDDYNWLLKNKSDLSKQQISSTQIQYLYMKSFFAPDAKKGEAYLYYYNQAKQFWNKQNSYNTAMIGLVLYRNNERRFVNVNIIPSVTENAMEDTTKGILYWKERSTCFWYASPIEHQSMMIEFMNEVLQKDGFVGLQQQVDAAKTWLILNKQTNNWKTTVATAEACNVLLNTGTNWLNNNQQVQIKLGNQTSNTQQTGYIKQRIAGNKVQPNMGNITVTINQSPTTNHQPNYGSIYWQYFEDLDKITAATSPLSLTKKLFIEKNTAAGKVLQPINENDELKVGDKVVVRIELRSDREMEYLHLKDMRASGSEPVNVLSGYKWQDGLGYYEATKDASTNFFIDRIQKGTHVFEYPIFITHTGTFSVGIATIQCMYAPEFTSHSEGIKIRVTSSQVQ